MTRTKDAFALIHFGNNPTYLELEIYFLIMLQKYTKNNIIYLYSLADTPQSFLEAVRPYVYRCVWFDDNEITYNIPYESAYSSFNTLRTCNYMFAYRLTEYNKVCIVESDLVIMGKMDGIFDLHTPSILYYHGGDDRLNENRKYSIHKTELLESCHTTSWFNGGTMLIKPDMDIFEDCLRSIKTIVRSNCKYPNEALFGYVNYKAFYNLPVKYNLSHYQTQKLQKFGMNPNGSDVLVYHFNETDYKHLQIVKENWLELNRKNTLVMEKYKVKKIPIEHFRDVVYKPYKDTVNGIMSSLYLPNMRPRNMTIPKKATSMPPTDIVSIMGPSFEMQPQVSVQEFHDGPNKTTTIEISKKEDDNQYVVTSMKKTVSNKDDEGRKEEITWVKRISTKHNIPYWYNSKTGKSVWEDPMKKEHR